MLVELLASLDISAVMSLYIKISFLLDDTFFFRAFSTIALLSAVSYIIKFCLVYWFFHGWFYFSVSDRLSTGVAVADIDLSLVDSVREKMPIAKVSAVIISIYDYDVGLVH